MHVRAYAKFNPYLDIVRKRPDGYHDLAILFRPISLCDELYVDIREKPGVLLSCNDMRFAGPDNLIHKAYKVLCDEFGPFPGFQVHLIKNIPSLSLIPAAPSV